MTRSNVLEELVELIATAVAEKLRAVPVIQKNKNTGTKFGRRRKPALKVHTDRKTGAKYIRHEDVMRREKAANVLAFLKGKQGQPVSAIAQALRVEKQEVVRRLAALREAGAVRMKGNRRSAVWMVTGRVPNGHAKEVRA
jgi:DNA-binding transcriptional ArsR family regulator